MKAAYFWDLGGLVHAEVPHEITVRHVAHSWRPMRMRCHTPRLKVLLLPFPALDHSHVISEIENHEVLIGWYSNVERPLRNERLFDGYDFAPGRRRR